MRMNKTDVPAKISIEGATARQQPGFGDASDYGKIAGEYFSLAKGTDLAPLLEGLDNDLCQSPHWGYMINGKVIVTYTDDTEETVSTGDLFYWPPGHTVRVHADADFIMFSPEDVHGAVVDHVKAQLAG